MKTLIILVFSLFFNNLSLSQDNYYTNLDNVVSHLAIALSSKIDNAAASRVVIGKIALRENVASEFGEEFFKCILKNNDVYNSFTIISNQYTRYISRKTSDSEILTIAKNAHADYIMRGEIKRINNDLVEIFLSLIDMQTMGEVGISALYKYTLLENNDEFLVNKTETPKPVIPINGLIGSYNFIEPQNRNFANKFSKQLSFDVGFIFTLYDTPADFLGIRTLMELQFSYIYGDFTNNISFYNLQPEGGSVYFEKEQLKEFSVYSGLLGFDINPKITETLSLIGGVSLTYGATVFKVYRLDQNTSYEWDQRYDQNTPEDTRTISFFSPGYSGGILFRLTAKSPIILFGRYYNSFSSKDTEWSGYKVGVILSY
jgi:hypothetical protein